MNKCVDKTFLWGGALSNVQAEGGNQALGKGLNVYDKLVVTPEKGQISQGDTNIAANHYHQFPEDIKLMHEMGFKAYRFSIVWSRINPTGIEDKPNKAGLKYYDRMIDELLNQGIEPVVSLVHFDMPSYLAENYNGFLSPKVIDYYLRHVEQVVNHFKDRVKYWITYNEINTAPFDQMAGLVAGSKRPDNMSKPKFFHDILYNTQLASSSAVNLIRRLSPNAKISGMITVNEVRPKRNDGKDRLAADITNKFNIDLYGELMCNGRYPDFYQRFLKLNQISIQHDDLAEIKLAADNMDYLAISCYQTRVISTELSMANISEMNQILFDTVNEPNPELPASHWGWTIDPEGFREELNHLYQKYKKPLFVVENGIGLQEGETLKDTLNDVDRIDYHKKYIKNMINAINLDGVNIVGYLMWAPIDFLSSHKEMGKRYGLIYIGTMKNGVMKRIPKKSFYWYQKVISTNGANVYE
ncbi:glycoside hydrolase family 1 protein [Lactiplantibacillus nangangensis]|uniref:Glycoside hydrolase family 1 protein n=1 Tax=Lactiplantibacillus nangangensis TaxID=2559917 RepID=A0ABW1SHV3_9LACO|nr:glycoside hydrolase family 1 protein [Lactiplantibacillus nangangensis]